MGATAANRKFDLVRRGSAIKDRVQGDTGTAVRTGARIKVRQSIHPQIVAGHIERRCRHGRAQLRLAR